MQLHDILERIHLTFRHKRLQIYAVWCLLWLLVAYYGLSLIVSTFDASLVDAAGNYTGNTPLLVLGCIALLTGAIAGMYYFGKWLHTDTTTRSDEQILLDAHHQIHIPQPPKISTSPVADKLNLSDRDEYFYSSVVRHFIHSQPRSATGEGEYSPAFISQLSNLSETHAFTYELIANTERQAITRAHEAMKQGTVTPTSPAFIELAHYLDTV